MLRDAGVHKFKLNGLHIEFEEPVLEPHTAGFARDEKPAIDEKHPGYSAVFGGQMPRFTPAVGMNGK